MKIAAVIVLYNPTKHDLENISGYPDCIDKLFVIDNTETAASEIETNLINSGRVEYIKNGKNLGIARALNQGAEMALARGYNWLLTLDQDSKPEKDLVKRLYDFACLHEDLNIGIISPYHKLNYKERISGLPEYEKKIEVMTSGNLLNLTAYKKIGSFVDELFIDLVDHEYCLRLQKHGFTVIQLNTAEMEHSLGNRSRHIFIQPLNLFKRGKSLLTYKIVNNHNYIRRYYIVRNRLYVSNKYLLEFPEYRRKMIKSIFEELFYIIFYESDKIKKFRSCLAGYIDYKKGRLGKKDFQY